MEADVPSPVAEPMDTTRMTAESAAPTADSEMVPEMVPATAVEAVEPESATKEAAPSEPAPAEPADVIAKEAVPSPSSRHPGPVKVVTDDGNEADAEGAEEEEESEDDVYEVDSVLEQRVDPNKPGGREFLVKWKGWGHRCSSWEPWLMYGHRPRVYTMHTPRKYHAFPMRAPCTHQVQLVGARGAYHRSGRHP